MAKCRSWQKCSQCSIHIFTAAIGCNVKFTPQLSLHHASCASSLKRLNYKQGNKDGQKQKVLNFFSSLPCRATRHEKIFTSLLNVTLRSVFFCFCFPQNIGFSSLFSYSKCKLLRRASSKQGPNEKKKKKIHHVGEFRSNRCECQTNRSLLDPEVEWTTMNSVLMSSFHDQASCQLIVLLKIHFEPINGGRGKTDGERE